MVRQCTQLANRRVIYRPTARGEWSGHSTGGLVSVVPANANRGRVGAEWGPFITCHRTFPPAASLAARRTLAPIHGRIVRLHGCIPAERAQTTSSDWTPAYGHVLHGCLPAFMIDALSMSITHRTHRDHGSCCANCGCCFLRWTCCT